MVRQRKASCVMSPARRATSFLIAIASILQSAQGSTGDFRSMKRISARPSPRQHGRIASISDDPHFTSPDGVPFDFHGDLDTTYCLISDDGLHINTVLKGYKDKRPFGASAPDAKGMKKRTWMKELAFFWKDPKKIPHVFHLVSRINKQAARGKGYLAAMSLDGKALKLPYDGKAIDFAGLHFQYTGTLTKENPKEEQEMFDLTIKNEFGGTLTMRPANPKLQTKDDAEVHFNLNIFDLNNTKHVHGVMGQTYRGTKAQAEKSARFLKVIEQTGKPIQADQDSGKGWLEGTIGDYVASSVSKPDCKFSMFKAGH